jgi:hypothetical protein
MKRLFSPIAFVFLVSNLLMAQELTPAVTRDSSEYDRGLAPFSLRSALFATTLSDFELSPIDTMPRLRTRRLLPQNMSFMEKGLWGEDGFLRSAGLASPLTPESRTSELSLRRGMLVAHQIGEFVTLGFMASAAYAGQKIIDGHSGYRPHHQAFVAGTIASYSVTGLLAVLSPPPVIRRDEVSTTTIHKTLAWVHFAGMVITPILGSMIGRHSDAQREHIHQLSGYITTATFAASLITVTF